jgi:putative integral membrane protein (TIGR02587 family)
MTSVDRDFFVGLARAFAGAQVFALPMLMTMEMWWLGFYVDPLRLALILVLTFPLLVGLSRFGGFKETETLWEDVIDALVAYVVALVAATITLWLLGVIDVGMAPHEIIGKIAIQAVPGSIGAMLARSLLGESENDTRPDPRPTYWSELFLMGVGALFLSLNVAPTEEIILIAYTMSPLQGVILALASLLLMHIVVYAVRFSGGVRRPREVSVVAVFAKFTVTGYALVLIVSFYVLWTFGRMDGTALEEIISAAVVLGFPGSLGAALARVIL